MRRSGRVFIKNQLAGIVWQDENGYGFEYDKKYLQGQNTLPVSLSLPLREEAYQQETMIPFFDGLIPEGWLLDMVIKTWKVDPKDRMGLLLVACKDCLGAVHVDPMEMKDQDL